LPWWQPPKSALELWAALLASWESPPERNLIEPRDQQHPLHRVFMVTAAHAVRCAWMLFFSGSPIGRSRRDAADQMQPRLPMR